MIKRVPYKFKEQIEVGIFKHNLGIRQYTVNGFYIEGIRLDIEHTFHIQCDNLEIRRNIYTIYSEKLSDVLFTDPSDMDEKIDCYLKNISKS
jgi:hypothetical protein